MKLGFSLPQFGAAAHRPQDIARFARQAEEMGADSLWVGDRLLAAVDPLVGYGGGDTIPRQFRAALDPFTVLTAAAGATERALLGTNVINAPWYPPALLARSFAGIDLLSGGRLLPGLGTGWSPEEYEAVGVPMAERGRRLDETLDVLDAFWSDGTVAHSGPHWSVAHSHVEVKPAQRPRPPIYLGGFAPAALERVGRRADGFLPITTVPGGPDLGRAVDRPLAAVREAAERHGRDPNALDVVLRINPDPEARVEDIATTVLEAGREHGVGHAFVDLMYLAEDVDRTLDLAERILEKVRGR
ncbi:TIGR03619 family F420-dependent LLM class oxidoreductase [Nocardiopsis baichengensis]|uniref:TIGR03619 family F420-dependent LLM class oxidoreductase n=1 Tax=Nocardiopsis baichengensis TaxID=280240 RepID=UPI0003497E59|nr:TIGR03619 family F420-dependent LLM class oxidoreductase [Nocardiopsis baichengensis]